VIEIDEDAFVKALNHVAATDEGKVILACLKEYCRFDGDIIAENSMENTYANATLRRAYLYFRSRIRSEHLKKIEYDYKRKVVHDRSKPAASAANTADTSRKPRGRKQ